MIKTFSITDLNLASVLLTLEYKLVELDRTNIKKVVFLFEDDGTIQGITSKYWENKVKLPALSLLSNQKNLKSRIYNNE